MNKNSSYYFEIGEKVYIIHDSSDGQSPQIKHCIVFDHECIFYNSEHPVYYDLKDTATGKRITTYGSVTHHFTSLFRSLKEAKMALNKNVNSYLEMKRYYS